MLGITLPRLHLIFALQLKPGKAILLSSMALSLICSTGCKQGEGVEKLFGGAKIGNSALSFQPNSYDFGLIAVSSGTSEKIISVTNSSTQTVAISSLTGLDANFTVSENTCLTELAAGKGCSFRLTFRPKLSGTSAITLGLNYKRLDSDEPLISQMGVSGKGVSPLNFSGLTSLSLVKHNQMTLNWTANSDAISFIVFDTTSGSTVFKKTLVNTGGTIASTVMTGLIPNTSYSFRVIANDQLGNSVSNAIDKTATTLANTAPNLAAITNPTAYSGATMASINANDSTTSGDTDADGDTITYSCRYDSTNNGSVGSGGTLCTSLLNEGSGSPTFNTSTGTLSGYIPKHADIGKFLEFEIVGTDVYGGESRKIFSTTIQAGLPVLTNISDRLFPSTPLAISELLSIDINNERSGTPTDTGMSYTCVFDRQADGSVSGSDACTSLPGTASFNTSTGVLQWTPNSSAFGSYELKFSGTNVVGSANEIVVVDMKPAMEQTNLFRYFDAQFATTSGGPGLNSPFASSWTDLVVTLGSVVGTLQNFGSIVSSGWAGSVSVSTATETQSPYRLVLDGTNDRVSFGTSMNSLTSFTMDTWLLPLSSTTTNSTVLGNLDSSSNKGMEMFLSRSGQGRLGVTVGGPNYQDLILSDGPRVYYRLGEQQGSDKAQDLSGQGNHGIYSGELSCGVGGAITGDVNTACQFDGTNDYVSGNGDSLALSTAFTVEAWIKASAGETQAIYVRNGQFSLQTNTASEVRGFVNSGNTWTASNCSGGLSQTDFEHFAITWDGANVTLYRNGSACPSASAGGSLTWGDGTDHNLYIGRFSGGGGFYAKGFVDEVAIYDKVLTPATIAKRYAAKNTLTCESKTRLVNGVWQHVTSSYNSSTSNLKLYLNGKEECSTTNASASAFTGSSSDFSLGSNTALSQFFNGGVGDMRLYSTSSSSIPNTNYQATKARFGKVIPSDIGTLRAWYQADAVKGMSGSTVQTWPDMSGNSNHLTQAVAANRPVLADAGLNNHPVISFDGANDYFSATLNANLGNSFSVISVTYFNQLNQANGDFDYIFNVGSGTVNQTYSLARSAGDWGSGANLAYAYNGATTMNGGAITGQSWKITTSTVTNSSPYHEAFVNGTSLSMSASAAPLNINNNLEVGRWQAGTHFINGKIAELIVFDGALTTVNRQKVECYLSKKYNVAVSHSCP
ncbi:hypothetical protein GW916_01990 [bacterium]|nr:hypothetical protein [bacterium]